MVSGQVNELRVDQPVDSFSQGVNVSLVLLDGGQLDVLLVPHSPGHMGEDLVTPHSPDGSGKTSQDHGKMSWAVEAELNKAEWTTVRTKQHTKSTKYKVSLSKRVP